MKYEFSQINGLRVYTRYYILITNVYNLKNTTVIGLNIIPVEPN